MPEYRYMVTVEAETVEQANEVMDRTVGNDIDTEFDYSLALSDTTELNAHVDHITAVTGGEVFTKADHSEALILADNWIVSVNRHGQASETVDPVEWETGWSA